MTDDESFLEFKPDSSQLSPFDMLAGAAIVAASSWWKGGVDYSIAAIVVLLLLAQFISRRFLKERNAIVLTGTTVSGPSDKGRSTTLQLSAVTPESPFRCYFPRGFCVVDSHGNRIWIRKYAFTAATLVRIVEAIKSRMAAPTR
jgi:hypothetical protein